MKGHDLEIILVGTNADMTGSSQSDTYACAIRNEAIGTVIVEFHGPTQHALRAIVS